jgi:hypothetical protein
MDNAFVVLRLLTDFEAPDGSTTRFANLLGFLPVFATEKKAIAASNGKFAILRVKLGEREREEDDNA